MKTIYSILLFVSLLCSSCAFAGSRSIVWDTSLDWGRGSSVFVDTTSISGSVKISTSAYDSTNNFPYSNTTQNMVAKSGSLTYASYIQPILYPTNVNINSITFYLPGTLKSVSDEFRNSRLVVGESWQDSVEYIESHTFGVPGSGLNWYTPPGLYTIAFNNCALKANTTYYIKFLTSEEYIGDPNPLYIAASSFTVTCTSATMMCVYSVPADPYNTEWSFGYWNGNGSEIVACTTQYMWLSIQTSVSSGSYVTDIAEATNISAWGKIHITDSQPAGSQIRYYIKTTDTIGDFPTLPYTPIADGDDIPTTGKYVQITSSFTRTSNASTPRIDKIELDYTIPLRPKSLLFQ